MSRQQVFLSYCHRDDEPYGPHSLRWVEEFEKALRASIGQRIGPERVELWRDKRRLAGNELFDEQIEQQLDRSAVFVTVLSQHYLSSPYCRKEFQLYGQRRLSQGDLHVDRLSRIIKVFRRQIDRADLRRFVDLPTLVAEVDGTTGYDLFYKDDNGIDRDVLLDPGKTGLYWQRADDIAYAIKRLLEARQAPAVQPQRAVTVYVARTASDLKEQRESLQRELEDRGVRVLPEQELPEDVESYGRVVQASLRESQLSVHLIGARYGAVPEGTDKSGVVLQVEMALAQDEPALRSLVWSPAELARTQVAEKRQCDFLDRLEQEPLSPPRAEFVRSSIEQLKALVAERLKPAPAEAAPATSEAQALYLVCDPSDRADAKPLHGALGTLGYEVVRPSLEGTPQELLEENQANLVACDTLVVVWGHAREAWVRGKLREAQQAPGWGRTRPFRGRFVVIGPPDTAAKQEFDPPSGVVVVHGLEAAGQIGRPLQ